MKAMILTLFLLLGQSVTAQTTAIEIRHENGAPFPV